MVGVSKLFGQPRLPSLGVGVQRNKILPTVLDSVLYLPGLPGFGPTIYDYSITARTGTPNHGAISGATWTRLPSGLWGLSFDGDDYVNITNSTTMRFLTGGLIFAWVNATSLATVNRRIIDKSTNTSALNGYYFSGVADATSITVSVSDVGTFSSAGALVTGKWILVGTNINNTARKIYSSVSGAVADVTSVAGGVTLPADAAVDVRVGNRAGASDRGWIGNIWGTRMIPAHPVANDLGVLNTVLNRERHLFGI